MVSSSHRFGVASIPRRHVLEAFLAGGTFGLAALLGACASQPVPPTAAPLTPTPPTPATALATVAPLPTSAPTAAASPTALVKVTPLKDALKLVSPEPASLDPASPLFNSDSQFVMRVFSNLLTLDEKGSVAPEMAATLPKASSDGLTYTFTLRDGLTYSDGKPLTAGDFEFAWKRHLDPATANPTASLGFAVKGARDYNTADPKVMSADELDISNYGGSDIAQAIDADPALSQQNVTGPGTTSWYVCFNGRRPPFDNVKVRQAFSLAFDRERLVRDVLAGLGIPAGQYVPPGQPGHYEGLKDTFLRHDPEQARQLLADAGYPNGQGFPSIKWTYRPIGAWAAIMQALAGHVQETLGIKLALDPVDSKVYVGMVTKPETTPTLYYLSDTPQYPDPQNWYSQNFAFGSNDTATGWRSARFDALCRQADQDPDPAKRDATYRQAAQILNDEVPVSFIWWSQAAQLVKPRVIGYKLDPTEQFYGQHNLYTMKLTT